MLFKNTFLQRQIFLQKSHDQQHFFLADRKILGLPSARYAPGGSPMVSEFWISLTVFEIRGVRQKIGAIIQIS